MNQKGSYTLVGILTLSVALVVGMVVMYVVSGYNLPVFYFPKVFEVGPAEFTEDAGELVTEQRPVSGIERIEFTTAGELSITQGSQEALTITGREKVIEDITTEVQNGVLYIGREQWLFEAWPDDVVIDLQLIDLDGIKVSGSGRVDAGSISSQDFTLNITGSGKVKMDLTASALNTTLSGSGETSLAGKVDSQVVNISGSGEHQAFDLMSKAAEVDISGSGQADLYLTDSIDLNITGSGDVNVKGDPASVNEKIVGSGDLNLID